MDESEFVFDDLAKQDSPDRALLCAALPVIPLLSMLERVGCGGIVLDGKSKIIAINPMPQQQMRQELRAGAQSITNGQLELLLDKVSDRTVRDGTSCWKIERNGRPPIAVFQLAIDPPRGSRSIILVHLSTRIQPKSITLHRMFALTNAEERLRWLLPLAVARRSWLSS